MSAGATMASSRTPAVNRLRFAGFWALCAVALGCDAAPDGTDAAAATDAPVMLSDGATAGPVCDADVAWFRRELWTPVFAVSCIGCHSAAGTARNSRLVLRSETEADWLDHNFRAVRAMAFTELAGVPMLLLRPSGRHPMGHTGGTVTPPGSTAYDTLTRFVARVQTPACDDPDALPGGDGGSSARCATVTPGPRVLRRLTPTEYDRTVRDLTGVDSHFGASFAADPVVDGFDNDATSLVVSPLLAEQLRVAAESVAADATRDLTRVSPCVPSGAGDSACARQLVEAFGARAFRRPLTGDEVTRYVTLHGAIAAGEGFNEGAEAVLSAMLQSPHFLYRAELGVQSGTAYRLTPWEVASELSYLFTASMPDAALFEAARSGALATPAGIEAQARRLVATPGARDALRRFVRQWLDVDRLATVPKDGATFAAFTPAVRASMAGEFDRFIDATLLRPGARLPELFTSTFTFVDPTLAAFYNLTPDGAADAQGFRRVSMVEAQRRGVLTLGAVMATHARPNSSSPVHRGRMVRERLLCQPLPPPPPGVDAQPPAPDARRSIREQYAMHASVRPCVDCHRLIDPIGFTFEFFDGVGRHRASENGMAIDARGEIVGSLSTDGAAADTRALIERLAASAEVQDCFTKQLFRYAYAMTSGSQTACALAELQQRFRGADLSIEELLVALTQSAHFTERDEGGAPAPSDAGAPTDASAPDASAPDASAAPDASVAPDVAPVGPMTTPGITTRTVRDSNWDAGFCERVTVTNTTSMRVTWTVVYPIMGRVTSSWSSERTGDSGNVVFRGAMWNAQLGPGESTELGFCAAR